MSDIVKKVDVPANILASEQYRQLPSNKKEEYTHNLLKEFLRLNPIGLTTSDIKKNSCLSHSVVWHHLEILASRGECLRVERGDTDVYHLNEVINQLEEFDILDDNTPYHFAYNFDLVQNVFGKFLRIQRLRESRSEAHTTRSGVIVPYHLVDKFIDHLINIKGNHLTDKHLDENKDKD